MVVSIQILLTRSWDNMFTAVVAVRKVEFDVLIADGMECAPRLTSSLLLPGIEMLLELDSITLPHFQIDLKLLIGASR